MRRLGGALGALLLAGLIAGACQGGHVGGAPGAVDGRSGARARGDEAAGHVEARGPIISETCASAVFGSTDAPLRRLSEREYRNTVAALFPGVSLPKFELVADARIGAFDNAAAGQAPSALAVERYTRAALAISEAAADQRAAWAPCSDNSAACVRQTLLAFAARAYRRPLSTDERARLRAFSDRALSLATPVQTIALGIESVLESPSFLYRPEFGQKRTLAPGALALSGRELATRLSYFLLASPPDPNLLADADAGRLDRPGGLEQAAKRLLSDPRARPALNDFFLQWLGAHKLEQLDLDKQLYPEVDAVLRADLHASLEAFIDYAVWERDSYRELMTSPIGFVNDRLAPLFGVAAPGTDQLTRVELDPKKRRGVLTQPGVLSATSHGIRHSPILRGVAVLNQLMCADLPPPPADVTQVPDLFVDESAICTTRDEVSMTHTAKKGCVSCHDAIDGAGFNFEHYDALGRYRTQENGCPIDATGTYPGTDLRGHFKDAVSLAVALPKSRTVTRCLAQQLFRYGLGRLPTPADTCELEALAAPLLKGNDSLQGLVLSLVLTPSFRSRPVQTVSR